MVDYRLKAQPVEIKADIKPVEAIWREFRRVGTWLVWRFRVLIRSRVR